jgi:hypothetical protein
MQTIKLNVTGGKKALSLPLRTRDLAAHAGLSELTALTSLSSGRKEAKLSFPSNSTLIAMVDPMAAVVVTLSLAGRDQWKSPLPSRETILILQLIIAATNVETPQVLTQ